MRRFWPFARSLRLRRRSQRVRARPPSRSTELGVRPRVEAQALASAEQAGEIKGLINYLMKHRHGTPFEHAAMTFFVHAPIFVWREWHRHRIGFSYNEESARYKQLDPVFWVPRQTRKSMKTEGFKSARPQFKEPNAAQWVVTFDQMRKAYQAAYDAYQVMIDMGSCCAACRYLL